MSFTLTLRKTGCVFLIVLMVIKGGIISGNGVLECGCYMDMLRNGDKGLTVWSLKGDFKDGLCTLSSSMKFGTLIICNVQDSNLLG